MKQVIRLTETDLHNIIRRAINEAKFGGESFHGDNVGDWHSMAKVRTLVNDKKGIDKEKNFKNFVRDVKNAEGVNKDQKNKATDKALNAADNLNIESIIRKHVNDCVNEVKFHGQRFHGYYPDRDDQTQAAEDFMTLSKLRDNYTDQKRWDMDNIDKSYLDDTNAHNIFTKDNCKPGNSISYVDNKWQKMNGNATRRGRDLYNDIYEK